MKTHTKLVAFTVAGAAVASIASGSPVLTTINNAGSEASQATLLDAVYGGTWTRLTGTQSYTNGSLTAIRIADAGLKSPLDTLEANAPLFEDDIWSGGEVMISVKAKYAADSHTFGWINGTKGTSGFQPILSTTDFAPVKVALTSAFRWALRNDSTNQLFTSRTSDNPGDKDMMATYAISGPGITTPTWLLVWEDRTTNSDRDFNDAAIQVTALPEPGVVALAAMGMLTVRRRRR